MRKTWLVLVLLTGLANASDRIPYPVDPADVLSVYDGDTFFIRLPECLQSLPWLCKRFGVRIEGLDTPERRGQCAGEEALALLARDHLARLLATATHLELLLQHRRERYGRLLGRLLVDGEDVVPLMVRAGLARPYDGAARQGWCE